MQRENETLMRDYVSQKSTIWSIMCTVVQDQVEVAKYYTAD